MAGRGFADAFRTYRATLRNPQWSVSAFNDAGELVVSLWEHHRDNTQKGRLVFTDAFSRWSGPGNSEFRRNVARAYEEGLDVRLIIAAAEDPAAVERGADASQVRKSFRVRPDLVGRVLEIAGERYTIGFDRR